MPIRDSAPWQTGVHWSNQAEGENPMQITGGSQNQSVPGWPPIMLGSEVLQAHSVDAWEHAQVMRGWQINYDQLSCGPFTGKYTEVLLDHIQLIRDHTNRCLGKSGQAMPGTIVMSIPLKHSGTGSCAGHSMESQQLLLADSALLPRLRTPPELDLVCLVIQRNWLEQEAPLLGYDITSLGNRSLQLLSLASTELAVLQSGLQSLFSTLPAITPYLVQPHLRQQLQQHLLQLFLDSLNTVRIRQPVPLDSRYRMVERAREVALRTPAFPPSIEQVCRHIGVSRRKLQDCFMESVGLSPAQYLRIVRLNGVRHELRSFVGAKVGDVAAKWGFWHLGRFASEYRDMFGELPSTTVNAAA